ncbi:MAG: ABC transporter ATP-binding protein [Caldiserica bacterium]|nr:ABC transporter ATP-binding protein [Caldisericota bacterium]
MSDFALQVENLTKEYRIRKGERVRALDSFSLQVNTGTTFGLLGPPGAGKSTLLKILVGLIKPTKGKTLIFGKEQRDWRTRARIGFLPERPCFYDFLTGEELLLHTGKFFGVPLEESNKRAEELLSLVGLEGAKGRKLRDYSREMLQRIGIARALINDPDLLLLDEPEAGIDPRNQKEIRSIITALSNRGKTVLLTSSQLIETGNICDCVAILYQGKVTRKGKLKDLLKKGEGKKVTFRIERRSVLNTIKASYRSEETNGKITVHVPHQKACDEIISTILSKGGSIIKVEDEQLSLEEIYQEETVRETHV